MDTAAAFGSAVQMGIGPRITIVLADRYKLVRHGVRLLLDGERDLLVVGEASDEAQALELVASLRPDVLVACPEIGGGMSGLELAPRVHDCSPRTRVVLLSMYSSSDYLGKVLRSGASGYVLKDSSASELMRAVRKVAAGQRYVTPLISQDGVETHPLRSPARELLTERQRQVLLLAAEGLSSGVIGRRLGISSRTVEAHRASVIRRLGLRTRTDLIRYALQQGLLPMRDGEPPHPPKAPRTRRGRARRAV